MVRKLAFVAILLLLVARASGQMGQPVAFVSADPSGSCVNGVALRYNYTNGKIWGCQNGVWTAASGAGAVASVFGRTGAVVAQTGDYSASMVTNAVDSTQSYSNPDWLSALAWTKLTGVPSTFNAGQLQGRTVASTVPSDAQYLGWNNTTSQWEPKTVPIQSVFGRSGAVTAQSGDYTTTQVAESGNLYFTNARVWAALSAASPLSFNDATGQFSCPICLTSNAVSSVFGRTGAVAAQSGDYTAAQVTNAIDSTQSYNNPAWLTGLAWSKITGVPSNVSNAVDSTGSYSNPGWLASLAELKLTFTDVTTGNASTSAHGFLPKLSGNSADCLNGAGGWAACATGGGGGTVTSVGLSMPSWLSVSGSPVTTSGTLTVTATTAQTSHQVIGTCGSATAFQPCTLQLSDLPTDIVLGAGNLTTAGLIPIVASSGTLTQDSSFIWDLTNHRLGIGISPTTAFDLASSGYPTNRVLGSYLSSSKYYAATLIGYGAAANQSATYGFAYNPGTPTSSFFHVTPYGAAEGSAFSVSPGGLVGLGTTAWVGRLTLTQDANGNDVVAASRATDTSPSGNFENFKNAAGTSLWKVDITGSLQAGTIPGGRVSGGISGNAGTATALATTPTQCGSNQFATGVAANGNANCAQPSTSNLSDGSSITKTIASGTASLGTTAIASGACATAVTVGASGVASTDAIVVSFNGDPTGVVGYQPTVNGMLTIIPYPTTGNVNFKVCNNTTASITPGAITLNWRVVR